MQRDKKVFFFFLRENTPRFEECFVLLIRYDLSLLFFLEFYIRFQMTQIKKDEKYWIHIIKRQIPNIKNVALGIT